MISKWSSQKPFFRVTHDVSKADHTWDTVVLTEMTKDRYVFIVMKPSVVYEHFRVTMTRAIINSVLIQRLKAVTNAMGITSLPTKAR